jgi:hypothetical protein
MIKRYFTRSQKDAQPFSGSPVSRYLPGLSKKEKWIRQKIAKGIEHSVISKTYQELSLSSSDPIRSHSLPKYQINPFKHAEIRRLILDSVTKLERNKYRWL